MPDAGQRPSAWSKIPRWIASPVWPACGSSRLRLRRTRWRWSPGVGFRSPP